MEGQIRGMEEKLRIVEMIDQKKIYSSSSFCVYLSGYLIRSYILP